MKDVTIYSTPTCHFCNLAKEFLKEHNVPYTEYNVAADREKLQEMIGLTGRTAVPVIKIGDDIMLGYSQSMVAERLGIAA
jgi:glutaredoxin